MTLAKYSHRLHAFRTETTYTLDKTNLTVTDAKGSTVYPLRDITGIRLAFAPSQIQRRRYDMTIRMRDRRKVKLSNEHYVGVAEFESRSENYQAFVKALHRRLDDLQLPIRYRAGNTASGFTGYALIASLTLVCLPIVGSLLVEGNGGLTTMVRWAAVIALLPTFWFVFRRNWPRAYDPMQIPNAVLP